MRDYTLGRLLRALIYKLRKVDIKEVPKVKSDPKDQTGLYSYNLQWGYYQYNTQGFKYESCTYDYRPMPVNRNTALGWECFLGNLNSRTLVVL